MLPPSADTREPNFVVELRHEFQNGSNALGGKDKIRTKPVHFSKLDSGLSRRSAGRACCLPCRSFRAKARTQRAEACPYRRLLCRHENLENETTTLLPRFSFFRHASKRTETKSLHCWEQNPKATPCTVLPDPISRCNRGLSRLRKGG
jgi:hypothetical protein